MLTSAPQFEEHLLVWDLLDDDDAPVDRADGAPRSTRTRRSTRRSSPGCAGTCARTGSARCCSGMSGGIDSALVAAIAADAIGGENVVGVSMPSVYSSEHSKDDAEDLAKRIGADYRVQPIKAMVDAFEGEIPLEGVAAENLQARVRGVILMAISNREGHLVIAPGNKSELATGYTTIYDAGSIGGFAPIKDVDKSRVWALARWRNNAALDAGEIPPIPESSITKPPSRRAAARPGGPGLAAAVRPARRGARRLRRARRGPRRAAGPRVRPGRRRQGPRPGRPRRVEAPAVPARAPR